MSKISPVCVCTYVWCKSRGSKQDSILWEISPQVNQDLEGLLWPKKKLMLRLLESHVKTFRVDIPFSLAVLQSSLLVPNSSCPSNQTSCSNTSICSHKSMLQGHMDLSLSLKTIWKGCGQMSHWEIEKGSINFVPCNLVATGCKTWKMDYQRHLVLLYMLNSNGNINAMW